MSNVLKYYPNGQDGDRTRDEKIVLVSAGKAYSFFRTFENGKPVVTVTGLESSVLAAGQPSSPNSNPAGPDGDRGSGPPPPPAQ